jgi:anti-anti-sigma factor
MPDYEEAPGILKINKDLGWVLEDELREKCKKLLESQGRNLLIDISGADHVCSANMVVFAYVGAMAVKGNKKIKMRVSSRVARAFQLAGFDEFLALEAL